MLSGWAGDEKLAVEKVSGCWEIEEYVINLFLQGSSQNGLVIGWWASGGIKRRHLQGCLTGRGPFPLEDLVCGPGVTSMFNFTG